MDFCHQTVVQHINVNLQFPQQSNLEGFIPEVLHKSTNLQCFFNTRALRGTASRLFLQRDRALPVVARLVVLGIALPWPLGIGQTFRDVQAPEAADLLLDPSHFLGPWWGHGGFLSHRGTPSHPPFFGIFHNINHPAIKGWNLMAMETSMYRKLRQIMAAKDETEQQWPKQNIPSGNLTVCY